MKKCYWLKDQTRQEIITKTQIPNNGNFKIYASYYNLIDVKGLCLPLNANSDIPTEKLFRKNGFEYFVLENNNQQELFILPNDNIEELTNRIITSISSCDDENDLLNLVFSKMY